MADDAVLAFDRGAILQRMLTGRIDFAGDAHDRRLPHGDLMVCSFLNAYRAHAETSKLHSKPGM
jgi:hypothetical protein